MDSTLYIIIGILWLGYTLYKANSKQQARSPLTQAEKNSVAKKEIFEESTRMPIYQPLNSFFETEMEQIPVTELSYDEITLQQNEKIVNYDTLAFADLKTDEVSATQKQVPQKISDLNRNGLVFDPVKAVIFSEIMKRNY